MTGEGGAPAGGPSVPPVVATTNKDKKVEKKKKGKVEKKQSLPLPVDTRMDKWLILIEDTLAKDEEGGKLLKEWDLAMWWTDITVDSIETLRRILQAYRKYDNFLLAHHKAAAMLQLLNMRIFKPECKKAIMAQVRRSLNYLIEKKLIVVQIASPNKEDMSEALKKGKEEAKQYFGE
jgi:hypothetical protein